MKLIILLAFWLPINTFLLVFSSIALLQYKNPSISFKETSFLAPAINFGPKVNISPPADIRVMTLKRFFQDYQSPLANFAQNLVKEADLWSLDYALLPAIAMQESGGCKRIPENSFNCWGLGIYGEKVVKFASFEEAITQVAKTIKEAYIKNGYTNATLVEDKWAPPSRGQWSYAVNYFIGKIRDYEQNIPAS